MNEWGIALVGFVGAVIGAVVSFVGLIWQRHVQRDYDIRQRCAEMIVHGENIRDSYLAKPNGMAMGDVKTFLAMLGQKSNQMTVVQRYLELVSKYRVEGAAQTYWMASFEYVNIAESRFMYSNKPTDERLTEASTTWIAARDGLINALNSHKRTHWWHLNRHIGWIWRRAWGHIRSRQMIRELTGGPSGTAR